MTTTRLALLALLLGTPAFAADDTGGDSPADTGIVDDTASADDTATDDTAVNESACSDCTGAGGLADESAGCGWDGRAAILVLGLGMFRRGYSLRSFQSKTRQ